MASITGRRMIVSLYNLQAHDTMASTHTETSDDHGQTTAYVREEDSDESDAEDWETLWICAVKVQ